MRTSDFRAFNEGFDFAVETIRNANDKGIYDYTWVVSSARGFRHDPWWREGTSLAIAWAQRNTILENTVGIYR